MKPTTKKLFADDGITLMEIEEHFSTDETARKYIERILWPSGPVCPHCKNSAADKIWKIKENKAKGIRAGLHRCAECDKEFTVTVGTIFEDSHIPLRKWLLAWYLICSAKKGVSSLQLQRQLKLGSYRTALFMAHRIRYALKSESFSEKLTGTVEVDETFIGGVKSGVGGGSKAHRTPVVAMVQRGGEVRSQVMPTVNGANLKQAIRENVQICSEVHTDANYAYRQLEPKFTHKSVKHCAGEYSRHEGEYIVTTASVESFFSLLKRGVVGTFHHVSPQHLHLYLAEFDHRHNCRKISDGDRTDVGLTKAAGKRLIYKTA
jgi:transposase-like protein